MNGKFLLGTFDFSFRAEVNGPAKSVLVISCADEDNVGESKLWVCFTMRQAMEGPVAFLSAHGTGEQLASLHRVMMGTNFTGSELHGPYYYAGLEAVMHGSVFALLAQAMVANHRLEQALAYNPFTGAPKRDPTPS